MTGTAPLPASPTVSNDKANRLGREPIGKLLLEYSLPAIIGMAASSLYNVIDRAFIGNGVGPMAIAGLGLTLPLMSLTVAFGAMIGSGASTMVSIRLGQQRKADATHILGNTLLLNFLFGIGITVLGLTFLDPMLKAFGASPETLPYAREFMQVILVANLFNHNFIGLNNVMRASGYPQKAMLSTLLTVGINICLAPLFIFVFHWGIRGAALATACAQFVGFCWVMLHFSDKNHYLHFQKGYFKLDKRIVGDILSIGLSPFFINMCASLVALIINKSLVGYGGDLYIGAYGIVGSVAMLFIMVVLGLNLGMQPIAGFNFGAKQYNRVMSVYRRALIVGSCITIVGFLAAQLFPGAIVSIFTNDPELLSICKKAIQIIFFSFPIVGFQVVTTNFFQSIGKAKLAILLSLSRQLIFLLPALFILPPLFGVDGVWMALPTGDTLASLVTLLVILSQRKKLFPADA